MCATSRVRDDRVGLCARRRGGRPNVRHGHRCGRLVLCASKLRASSRHSVGRPAQRLKIAVEPAKGVTALRHGRNHRGLRSCFQKERPTDVIRDSGAGKRLEDARQRAVRAAASSIYVAGSPLKWVCVREAMHALRQLFSTAANSDESTRHREPTDEEQTVGSIVAIVFSIITVTVVLGVIFGPMVSPYDWWYAEPTRTYVEVLPGQRLHGDRVEMPTLRLNVSRPAKDASPELSDGRNADSQRRDGGGPTTRTAAV